MKKISTLLFIATLFLTISCNNKAKVEEVAEVTTSEVASFENKTYLVSNSASEVAWEGFGVGKTHNGTVNVVAGKFDLADGAITAGKLSLDMTSIVTLDVTDPDGKAKLEGHLKSEDFFGVEAFPVATLDVTDGSDLNAVKANLTIKDKTNEVVFPVKLENVDGAVVLTTELLVNRTKYDIVFASGNFFENLGDKLIKDEFKITVKLLAK